MSRRRRSDRRRPSPASTRQPLVPATVAVVAGVIAMAVVSGCGGGSGSIQVSDPWARPSPPGTDSTAIYVVLTNETDDVQRLVTIETDRCQRIEFHRTEIASDGVASMVQATEPDLVFGPGEELAFEPNALHVMCVGIEEPFAVGEDFDIGFTFADLEPFTVSVAVRRA